MHLLMIFIAICLAWYLRSKEPYPRESWTERWQRSLLLFLFPPLLLLMTAASILCMGPEGQMVELWDGWFSYELALGFFGWAGVNCLESGDSRTSFCATSSYLSSN
jgi:hypothetical protein